VSTILVSSYNLKVTLYQILRTVPIKGGPFPRTPTQLLTPYVSTAAASAPVASQTTVLLHVDQPFCTFEILHSFSYRIAGHHQLADRLVEYQYELTDKLSNFVSGRKPVHSVGEHFLVPQVGSR
jgi:hypothetical protein